MRQHTEKVKKRFEIKLKKAVFKYRTNLLYVVLMTERLSYWSRDKMYSSAVRL
jgi:hypothetical protein